MLLNSIPVRSTIYLSNFTRRSDQALVQPGWIRQLLIVGSVAALLEPTYTFYIEQKTGLLAPFSLFGLSKLNYLATQLPKLSSVFSSPSE